MPTAAKLALSDSDVTVTDLQSISSGITKSLQTDDAAAQRAIAEAFNEQGLLSRLFPGPVGRERQRLAVQAMKGQASRKAAMLELYTQTQLEIARKQADALVASVGISLQVELAAFAAENIKQLSKTLNDTSTHFLDTSTPQLENLERYKDHPELYRLAKEQLDKQFAMQFDVLTQLMEGFVSHLRKRVAP